MYKFFVTCGLVTLISSCGQNSEMSGKKSLTGPEYHGKKYYFGWGLNGNGDESMDNEVKYDVFHTNNIFTKSVGGDYIGKTMVGDNQVSTAAIKTEWQILKGQMTPNDMYVQYSSGHGYEGGLAAGGSYRTILDATLALNAKETIIFTMACLSGGLVYAFNSASSRWSNYHANGRTLFVMASSRADEESSTGPGTDPDEANGPEGSAGSAYGHALWKSLIGYADKTTNGGNGDGIVTLKEIIDYSVYETEPYGHTPVYTGSYDENLAIAKVPTVDDARRILGDSEEGQRRLTILLEDGVLR